MVAPARSLFDAPERGAHAQRAAGSRTRSDGSSLLGGRDVERGIAQLFPRADTQLGEDLAQVPLDGARAEEQPRADLGIREALPRETGDVELLGGQVLARAGRSLPDLLAGRNQLAACTLGESRQAHRRQHGVSGAQLLACVDAASVAPKPLSEHEVATGDFHPRASAP